MQRHIYPARLCRVGRQACVSRRTDQLSNNEWARTKIVAIDLSHQLRSVEDRINQLQAEIKDFRHRVVQAETWLERFQREVEQKLIAPRQAPNQRSKA